MQSDAIRDGLLLAPPFHLLRRRGLALVNQTQSDAIRRNQITCSAVGALRLSASGTAGGRTKASSDSRSCCNCDEGRNQWYSVAVSRGTQGYSVVLRRT